MSLLVYTKYQSKKHLVVFSYTSIHRENTLQLLEMMLCGVRRRKCKSNSIINDNLPYVVGAASLPRSLTSIKAFWKNLPTFNGPLAIPEKLA